MIALREIEISRADLGELLDATNPARSAGASRAYERFLDAFHASADVHVAVRSAPEDDGAHK